MPEKSKKKSLSVKEWVFWALFILLLLLVLYLLKTCESPPMKKTGGAREKPEEASELIKIEPKDTQPLAPSLETLTQAEPEPVETIPRGTVESVHLEFTSDTVYGPKTYIDSLFVYADPWGGRHFDSVTVSLHCREDCPILFSFADSINLKSYGKPLVIKTDKSLWIAGINELGEQSRPVKLNYTIERKKRGCSDNMMPFSRGDKNSCVDVYEWPNREGEIARSFVNQKAASDSCSNIGKRLCTLEEWQTVCRGPSEHSFPYGNKYNENYCPAKEKQAQRSGRSPACRSYYGIYDMTGNLWEWTATEAQKRPGHFWVAGGNWNMGAQATCEEAKYSFYPQNKYLFVGFRCCQDM